jgi:hypothetical protein
MIEYVWKKCDDQRQKDKEEIGKKLNEEEKRREEKRREEKRDHCSVCE